MFKMVIGSWCKLSKCRVMSWVLLEDMPQHSGLTAGDGEAIVYSLLAIVVKKARMSPF